MKSKSKIRGFTLIELVIVITIIAILAAVALPRFAALQQQARIAKAQAMMGSVRAAAAIAKASCLADLGTGSPGTCTAAGGTVNMEGTAVAMVNQYPSAISPTGIQSAAQLSAANDGLAIALGATTTIDILGGTAPNCRVSYTAPAAAGNSPTITLVTTGC